MKSFYSLIKIAPNSLSDDNLTIGIIASTIEGNFKVKFSKNKISISKNIISAEVNVIDFFVNEIAKKVMELNKIHSNRSSELFGNEHSLNIAYFDYLTNYSNGILRFSSPQIIHDRITDTNFNKLFNLFVDDKIEAEKIVKKSDEEFYGRVKNNLIERVKDQVHTNYKVNSKLVPTIPTNNFELDCIGLNGTLIGAKSLPFTTSRESLSKNINTYISIIAHLSKLEMKNLNDIKFFLIADRPSENNPDILQYYEQIDNSKSLFNLIPSTNVEEVAKEIEEKQAHKFLKV